MIFFNIFTNYGFEVASGFTESEDTIKSIVEDCKEIANDFILHPEDYE